MAMVIDLDARPRGATRRPGRRWWAATLLIAVALALAGGAQPALPPDPATVLRGDGVSAVAGDESAMYVPEILAFLHTGITNAGSEGTNRVIKTVARDAYGFRNPVNQRLRTRTATTRKAAGISTPVNFEEPQYWPGSPMSTPTYPTATASR
ncbi:transposase [Dactylosporangium sp. NPDC048998]|uniref:transposase n=1 Tax=Dactylosporangium sp. NPDC048998 TaxID=3363976 RepID=UPI003719080C